MDFHANRFWDDPKLREQEIVSDDFEDLVAAMEAAAMARPQLPRKRPDEPVDETAEESGSVAEEAAQPPPAALPGEDEWETVVEDRYGS